MRVAKARGTVNLPPSSGKFAKWAPQVNKAIQQLRDRVYIIPPSKQGGGGSGFCKGFHKIYQDDNDDWFIRGGSVTGGDSVHQVNDKAFSVASDFDHVVWLSISVTANEQDNVLLPGLETSSAPSFETGASYPDQTLPTIDTPAGTQIIPLGTLVVESGVPTYTHTGPCSPVQLNHCPGTLSYA